jgi:hypothetical protein
MNVTRIVVLVSLVFIAAGLGDGQAVGLHTEYMKDDKTTRVETSLLYVRNTPDQFVELMFRGWFKGEKPVKPPTKIAIEMFSLAKNPLYESKRSLIAICDGAQFEIGQVSDLVLNGETKNGIDTFYGVRGNPNVGMQLPVSQNAQIKSTGNGVTGLSMEWIGVDMKPEQFFKLAKSKTIELRLGNSSFTFSDTQMNIIRNLANAITPQ